VEEEERGAIVELTDGAQYRLHCKRNRTEIGGIFVYKMFCKRNYPPTLSFFLSFLARELEKKKKKKKEVVV